MVGISGLILSARALGSSQAATSGSDQNAPKRIVRDEPSLWTIQSAIVSATNLIEAGRYDDAVQTLESLSCLRCDEKVSILLAAAFEANREPTRAQQVLEEAHSLWPSNNSIASGLARQYLLSGRANLAADVLHTSDVSSITPAQELVLRIEVSLAVNQLVDAERVAEILYKAHPSEESTLLLANVWQMQGRAPKVVNVLKGERSRYGNSPKFLITLAESQFDTGNYEGAEAELQKSISLDPSSGRAHYLLGNTLVKLKQMDRALAEYNSAVRLAPENPRPHCALGSVLLLHGDVAGAEKSLRKSLALDGQYAPAHCELGKLYRTQGRFLDAIEEFHNAIRDNPQLASAYYHLGEAYRQIGHFSDSKEAFDMFRSIKAKEPKLEAPEDEQIP